MRGTGVHHRHPLWGLVLAVPILTACAAMPGASTTCTERRVYIGSFGQSDHAAQFAIALEKELRDEGFTVVSRQEDADLVLSGVLTMTTVGSGSVIGRFGGFRFGPQPTVAARAIRARSGESVWAEHYESSRPKGLDDRAEDVAEDLWKACRKGWRR